MTTTLITGATKGLGYEAARRLLALGHTVHLGVRDAARGEQAAAALGVGAHVLLLDVSDEESVHAAAARLAEQVDHLDVLVNNAAIVGTRSAVADTTADDLREAYETNVLGAVRTVHAFLPLLRASEAPVIVNVGSGLGSLARTTDPERMESQLHNLAYTSSKAALTMLTVQYAKAFPELRINIVDPGYTATDLNGHQGTQTVEEGTDAIVAMACIGPDGPSGTFTDRLGPVAW